jgi:hypothetical protein
MQLYGWAFVLETQHRLLQSLALLHEKAPIHRFDRLRRLKFLPYQMSRVFQHKASYAYFFVDHS